MTAGNYLSAREWDAAARAVIARHEVYHGPLRNGDGGSGEAMQSAFDQLPGDVLAVLLRDGLRPWDQRESSLTWEDGALVAVVDGQEHRIALEPPELYRAGMAALNPRPAQPGCGPVVLCLCYFGLVSGLMERFVVERALLRLGIRDGQVEVVEKRYWAERLPDADVVVYQPDELIAAALDGFGGSVVAVTNLLDEDEVADKLAAGLRSAGYDPQPAADPPRPPRGRWMRRFLDWSHSVPQGWRR